MQGMVTASRYNSHVLDLVVRVVARVVVPLFLLGLAGSLGVIAVSFAEDLKELFGAD